LNTLDPNGIVIYSNHWHRSITTPPRPLASLSTLTIGPVPSPHHQVQLNTLDQQQCKATSAVYAHYLTDATKIVCTIGSGKDTCFGDSGGPLLIKNENNGMWNLGGEQIQLTMHRACLMPAYFVS
jgi:hypothetical protein